MAGEVFDNEKELLPQTVLDNLVERGLLKAEGKAEAPKKEEKEEENPFMVKKETSDEEGDIEEIRVLYAKLAGKEVANSYKNNTEWMLKKIAELS